MVLVVPIVVAGVMLLSAGIVVGFVMLIVTLARRQTQARNHAWAVAAQAHGLSYDGSEIAGRKLGVAMRVCTVTRGSGDDRRTYTVVAARLDMPLDLGLQLRDHGFFNDLFHKSQDIVLGDPAFDSRFIVSGDEPHRVSAVLTPELRQALLHGLVGSYNLNDHGLTIECSGVSTRAEWLSWAIDLAARITQELDRARRRVPVASALRGHGAAWAAFAQAHGMRGSETPLAMWGRIEGFEVSAYAVRTNVQTFQLDVSLRFATPLGIGLSVQAMGMMDKVAVFLGGQDVMLGHSAFDEGFRVKTSNIEACRALLTPQICDELLAIQTRLGPLSLDDNGLAVRLPYVPREPNNVPRTVHHLTGLMERIGSRAREAARGPYR